MRSGLFNRHAVIETPTQGKDAGFPREDWEAFAEVLGYFKWERGEESVGPDHTVGVKRGTFIMPFLEGVDPKMRLKLLDQEPARFFQITSTIDPGESRRQLEIRIIEVPKEAFAR